MPDPDKNFAKKIAEELAALGVSLAQPDESVRLNWGIELPMQLTCGDKVPAREMAERIAKFAEGKPIRFLQLSMPHAGIEVLQTQKFGRVLVRYLECYVIQTDELEGRYDVMIQHV